MKRIIAATAVAGLIFAAPVPSLSQSAPSAPAPAQGALGYYIMQGNVIVSAPFPSVAACYKALAQIKKTQSPGNDSLVCAHRRP